MRYAIYYRYAGYDDWRYYCVCTGAENAMINMAFIRNRDRSIQVVCKKMSKGENPIDLRRYL
jgi:hypothetical protein